jgi:hypothetical protein
MNIETFWTYFQWITPERGLQHFFSVLLCFFFLTFIGTHAVLRRFSGPVSERERRWQKRSRMLHRLYAFLFPLFLMGFFLSLMDLLLPFRPPNTLFLYSRTRPLESHFSLFQAPSPFLSHTQWLDIGPLVDQILVEVEKLGGSEWVEESTQQRQHLAEVLRTLWRSPDFWSFPKLSRTLPNLSQKKEERLPFWIIETVEISLVYAILQHQNVLELVIATGRKADSPHNSTGWNLALKLLESSVKIHQIPLRVEAESQGLQIERFFKATLSPEENTDTLKLHFLALISGTFRSSETAILKLILKPAPPSTASPVPLEIALSPDDLDRRIFSSESIPLRSLSLDSWYLSDLTLESLILLKDLRKNQNTPLFLQIESAFAEDWKKTLHFLHQSPHLETFRQELNNEGIPLPQWRSFTETEELSPVASSSIVYLVEKGSYLGLARSPEVLYEAFQETFFATSPPSSRAFPFYRISSDHLNSSTLFSWSKQALRLRHLPLKDPAFSGMFQELTATPILPTKTSSDPLLSDLKEESEASYPLLYSGMRGEEPIVFFGFRRTRKSSSSKKFGGV